MSIDYFQMSLGYPPQGISITSSPRQSTDQYPFLGSSFYLLSSLISSLAPKSLTLTGFYILHCAEPLATWV